MLSLLVITLMLAAVFVAAGSLALSSPAEARPHAHRHHHAHLHHGHHQAARRHASADEQPSGLAKWWSSVTRDASLVTLARQDLGKSAGQLGLPRSLWCADWVNRILARAGRSGTGSRAAASFASYGRNVGGPQVGAIAVMHRRGGGHVGIVTGVADGGVVVISGNHLGAVREAVYPRNRIYAYRG